MKITLVFAPERQAEVLKTVKKIVDHLKKKKHIVNQEILRRGILGRVQKTDSTKFYQALWKKAKTGDAVIAELSSPSTEVGYIIADALREKKPVLVLVNKKAKGGYMPSLSWKKPEFLMTKVYVDEQLEGVIDEFLSFATTKVDTKFILIITPEIDAYLRWKASEEGVRKAEVVRRAIASYMENDEGYKKS